MFTSPGYTSSICAPAEGKSAEEAEYSCVIPAESVTEIETAFICDNTPGTSARAEKRASPDAASVSRIESEPVSPAPEDPPPESMSDPGQEAKRRIAAHSELMRIAAERIGSARNRVPVVCSFVIARSPE